MIEKFENRNLVRKKRVAVAVILSATLAGCQTNGSPSEPPLANGSWASSDGVYVAEFLNGSFRAVANDTGNVISEGTYIASSKENIKLRWTSNLTGQTNQADCIKPDVNVMNCTDQNGNKFTLRRNA